MYSPVCILSFLIITWYRLSHFSPYLFSLSLIFRFLLIIIPFMGLSIHLANLFRKAIRQVKRIENISRSPLYGHVASSMSGLPSIRVYNIAERELAVNKSLVDRAATAHFAYFQLNRWFGFRTGERKHYLCYSLYHDFAFTKMLIQPNFHFSRFNDLHPCFMYCGVRCIDERFNKSWLCRCITISFSYFRRRFLTYLFYE